MCLLNSAGFKGRTHPGSRISSFWSPSHCAARTKRSVILVGVKHLSSNTKEEPKLIWALGLFSLEARAHSASRESMADSRRWETVLFKYHLILNNCSCSFFYVRELLWFLCLCYVFLLTICVYHDVQGHPILLMLVKRREAGKAGNGEQEGAGFPAEIPGCDPRRCVRREGRWVQWTTLAVNRGGSRSWEQGTPRVGWIGNVILTAILFKGVLTQKQHFISFCQVSEANERARHSGPSQIIKGFG